MSKGPSQRMKVWRWSGRDRNSLYDLEFVVACPAKRDLHPATVRLGLPKPDLDYHLVKPSATEYDAAMAEPGHVFWRDIEGGDWQREPALESLRGGSMLTALRGGKPATPLHRPDSR